MRLFTVRRLALAVFVPALLVVSIVPGCSNESEGERCGDDIAKDDDDCQSGLVCTDVHVGGMTEHRCCNPVRSIINDSRCEDTSGIVTDAGSDASVSGGSGGTSGTSGGAGTGGTAGSSGSGGSGGSSTTDDGGAAGVAGAAGSN